MTDEVLSAAERTFHAAGAKPKDVAQVLNTLSAEHQVTASVNGGLLTLTQNDTPVSVGTVLSAYRQKHPRDFYGSAGDVTFKQDIAGDDEAKVRYIRENGYEKWAALPLNEKSAGAQNAVTSAIPSAYMKRSEYLRLSVAEKTKLAAEIGPDGIGRIMARR